MKRAVANWHMEFMHYMQGQESPVIFKVWCAFLAVSATLGRHVWFDMGYFKTYPNLYVILIAASAKCRKGPPIRVAMELIDSLDDPPEILAEKITPEAIVQSLESAGFLKDDAGERKDCESVVSAEELNVFLGEDAFRSGTAALLTRFFDCPNKFKKKTKTQGAEFLHNVVLNLLGASTPDWLRRSIPHDAAGGGFMSRFMFVYAEALDKLISIPKITGELAQAYSNLTHDLSMIRELKGEFTMTSAAEKFFDGWYKNWMQHMGRFAGYEAKKHTYVLKLSMILSACESDSLIIEKRHLDSALECLKEIEPGMKEVTGAIFVSPGGELAERVLEHIKRTGREGATKTQLLRELWRYTDTQGLAVAIDTLFSADLITAVEMRRKKGKSEQKFYKKGKIR